MFPEPCLLPEHWFITYLARQILLICHAQVKLLHRLGVLAGSQRELKK